MAILTVPPFDCLSKPWILATRHSSPSSSSNLMASSNINAAIATSPRAWTWLTWTRCWNALITMILSPSRWMMTVILSLSCFKALASGNHSVFPCITAEYVFSCLAAEKVRHNGILLFCFLLWFVYNTVCLHIASGEGEYFLHKEGLVCVVIDAYNLESLFCWCSTHQSSLDHCLC